MIIDGRRLEPSLPASRGKHQIREGLAYVTSRSDILLVLMVVFFVGTFGMNFQLTSALMAQQEFGKGAEQYGILGTFMAVGSLAGALLAARRVKPPARSVHRDHGADLRCDRGGRRSDAHLRDLRRHPADAWAWSPCSR